MGPELGTTGWYWLWHLLEEIFESSEPGLTLRLEMMSQKKDEKTCRFAKSVELIGSCSCEMLGLKSICPAVGEIEG